MIFEALLIIAVFGGILAVMLYFYLFKSEPKSKNPVEVSDEPSANVIEPIAEKVLKLFEKVEQLEKNFESLEAYVEQKVAIWKKREERGVASRQ